MLGYVPGRTVGNGVSMLEVIQRPAPSFHDMLCAASSRTRPPSLPVLSLLAIITH